MSCLRVGPFLAAFRGSRNGAGVGAEQLTVIIMNADVHSIIMTKSVESAAFSGIGWMK